MVEIFLTEIFLKKTFIVSIKRYTHSDKLSFYSYRSFVFTSLLLIQMFYMVLVAPYPLVIPTRVQCLTPESVNQP